MGKGGGSSAPTQQNVTTTTSNLPSYAQPYFENIMNRAQAQSYQQYTPYGGQRITGFTPAQEQIQQNVLGMSAPNQFATGSALAYQAGLGALNQQYGPGQFSAQQVQGPGLAQYQMGPALGVQGQQYAAPEMGTAQTTYSPELQAYQMGPAQQVSAQGVSAPTMQGAQTGYEPDLTSYQMGPVQQVSAQQVGAPEMQAAQTAYGQQPLEQFRMATPGQFGAAEAQQYMSPYIQNVVDVQKREAIRGAQQAQLAQDLGAARQGTYGGDRKSTRLNSSHT